MKPTISDVRSGFLIFLIALPLCLGIAIASSCPPVAGIITAIVGGIVASFLGSARLSIKGPAAGLIVIVLGAVSELGQGDALLGYKRCLAVGVAAAVCQIIFASLKVGRVGKLMPQPVIHGMLAAIGVIIVAKQIHVMLGVTPHSKSPLGLLAEIPTSIRHLNPEVLFVGALTLLIVVVMPLIPILALKKIPAALIALAVTIPLALWWHLDSKFFVLVPADFLGSFTLPDFDILKTWAAWKYVAMFALIGSLESLLTVTAIDSLDPDKGQSNLDADLRSVGIGNLIASMIGGLPMISEVVRSKANMDAGAKSSWSNFFHGFYLLVAISLFAPEIDLIPLESLAAMLIAIGYRLASPREFYKMYQEGFDHLFVFIATLIITLKTDLLVGVCSGVVLHILIQKVLAVRSQVAK